MARLKLASPWVTFYHELNAFFDKDPDVRVIYDEDENILNIYVEDAAKAAALTELIPIEKNFGTIVMPINVIPANKIENKVTKIKATSMPTGKLFEAALNGNEHLADIITIEGVFNNPMTYVVFKKEVIQYFNDSLGDFNGVCSTLCQNIAKDIFTETEGVYFCTDVNNVSTLTTKKLTDPWTISLANIR